MTNLLRVTAFLRYNYISIGMGGYSSRGITGKPVFCRTKTGTIYTESREMELRLRQYKPCDAQSIVRWIKDEDALRKWSSDRFGVFDNNESAYKCYKAAGFRENGKEMFCELFGGQWRIVEMEINKLNIQK